jgi:hypothetical protein
MRPDGTIAPYGMTDAREYDVPDTHAFRLGQLVNVDGEAFLVTLLNHKDGFIGVARGDIDHRKGRSW